MPYKRVSKKPEGQPTRGKTASNRLRRIDNFILLYEPSLLTRTDGLFRDAFFVDLGYGFDAQTTLESDFFEAWKQSAAETAAMKAYGLRQWFVQTADALARKGYTINLQKKFLLKGWMIWEL